MSGLDLSDEEQAMLDGALGGAVQLAMRIVVRLAGIQGASRLIEVSRAHIDSCLYHGQAGLDFAERLVELGAQVGIPTTLNVATLDLLHPDLYRGDESTAVRARRLMDAYTAMGCRPTWTCAPYQLPARPELGEHVAWAESNAIVFANSWLGARTNRYGDFIDICAAVTGRVPESGLHLDAARSAAIVFRLGAVSDELKQRDVLFPVLGHLIGGSAGSRVVAIDGLAHVTEDQFKALGAAAASSGAVALIHVIGITPEAPDLASVVDADAEPEVVDVTPRDLVAAREALTTTASHEVDAVSLGTPHASVPELYTIAELLRSRHVAKGMALYVNTGRDVLAAVEAGGLVETLTDAGVTIVTDTCTYITPILDPDRRVVMTDSAKWAFYAPGNIGVDVVFGSTEECIETAVTGSLVHSEGIWDA